jgi:hypothetical protein
LIHAAGESAGGPLPADTHAIALACRDEAHLLLWEERLREAGLPFLTIREPDAPYLGAATAIGLKPMPRTDNLRRLLGKLPLYGGPSCST